VALKAGPVNNPPDNDEGRFYAEIGRSKPAPQGICVANSSGKVLDWALMFDDDKSVVAFLDRALQRFARYPDAKQPVSTERFMKYPSLPLADVADSGRVMPPVARHAHVTHCPGTPPHPPGTAVARLFGRALDAQGRPISDTRRQEHYVEDRFDIPADLQAELARSLAGAGTQRFRIADDLARLLVSHAFLGQLDVNPAGPPGGTGTIRECEFWGQATDVVGGQPPQIRIEGRSDAAGATGTGDVGDGRNWSHEVKLTWEGLIEINERRITSLALLANGSEKLKWRTTDRGLTQDADVAHLPAGHPIDLACGVRYGILAEPVAAELTAAQARVQNGAPAQRPPSGQIPDEARRQVLEMLGTPFLVFQPGVQVELALMSDQKRMLDDRLTERVQDAMQFFQRAGGMPPDERDHQLQKYRQNAGEQLVGLLNDELTAGQFERYRQLMLQREGAFALFKPGIARELQLTDEQRRQFMELVTQMQKKIEPLAREAQTKGNADEIRPRVMKIRQEHSDKIEKILTEMQSKQWQAMLGKPFNTAH
jgi:hypothetical protein